jgi:hypothetical protein
MFTLEVWFTILLFGLVGAAGIFGVYVVYRMYSGSDDRSRRD